MKPTPTIHALQTALAEALDMLTYYTEIESRHTGQVDPLVQHRVENLQRILALSNYVEKDFPETDWPLCQ